MESKPVKTIPEHMLDAFTLNGKIRVADRFMDESAERKMRYMKDDVNRMVFKARNNGTGHYPAIDPLLYKALDQFPVTDKHVLVIGSQGPWYEAIALSRGASHVTASEYQHRVTNHPQMTCLKPDEVKDRKFDAIFCISSIEHDGLGRYGDPVDPFADICAMMRFSGMLTEGGKIYLSVPVGLDCLVWNAHRVYGKVRLPLLLMGWNPKGMWGFEMGMLEQNGDRGADEALFVLEEK